MKMKMKMKKKKEKKERKERKEKKENLPSNWPRKDFVENILQSFF